MDAPVIPQRSFSVVDYGAIGDGIALDTQAIQSTLDLCAKAGGGTVVIPCGVWLTGPLRLRSRVELCVESGAIVQFSRDFHEYELIHAHFEGQSAIRCRSPLDGENLFDVAITGQGIFDGGGDAWRPVKKSKTTAAQWRALAQSGGVMDERAEVWWPTKEAMHGAKVIETLRKEGSSNLEDFRMVREYLRPSLLSLRNCQRIRLDGPTFQNSPGWCLHPWNCRHITISHVVVRNPWYAQNGDGLDLDSCQHCVVEHSQFDVGDDAICLKSGRDRAGRELQLATAHVVIKHCVVYRGHGGVVVGSEMSGGVHDVSVEECSFLGTDIGLRFKSLRGRGGQVQDIRVKGVRMLDIVHEAISFDLFYEQKTLSSVVREQIQPVSQETPEFRNIFIEETKILGANDALVISGLPEMPVQDLVMRAAVIRSRRGIRISHGRDITFDSVALKIEQGPLVELHHAYNVQLDGVKAYDAT